MISINELAKQLEIRPKRLKAKCFEDVAHIINKGIFFHESDVQEIKDILEIIEGKTPEGFVDLATTLIALKKQHGINKSSVAWVRTYSKYKHVIASRTFFKLTDLPDLFAEVVSKHKKIKERKMGQVAKVEDDFFYVPDEYKTHAPKGIAYRVCLESGAEIYTTEYSRDLRHRRLKIAKIDKWRIERIGKQFTIYQSAEQAIRALAEQTNINIATNENEEEEEKCWSLTKIMSKRKTSK